MIYKNTLCMFNKCHNVNLLYIWYCIIFKKNRLNAFKQNTHVAYNLNLVAITMK